MKRILITLGLIFLSVNAYTTHWYSWQYKFPHFSYQQGELMGSMSVAPDMFLPSAMLNSYVKSKIEKGELNDKPVIYTVNNYDYTTFERSSFSLEVYQTQKAYYINLNYHPFCSTSLTVDEITKTIDYFSSPLFQAFYCDTTLQQCDMAKEIFFNKIKPISKTKNESNLPDSIDIYEEENIKIKYINNEFKAYWKDEEISLPLSYPIAKPIKFNDRIIIIDSEHFYAIEDGSIVKNVVATEILWDGSDISANSNIPDIQIFSDWLNIYSKSDDGVIYSYSYSQNRFYNLKEY